MNNNNISCSGRESFFLTLILLTNRIFTNLPLILTRTSGTGAPLSALLSGSLFLVVFYFTIRKFIHSNCGNILSSSEKLFGKFTKYTLSLALISYLGLSSLYLLSEITFLTKMISFPTAPIWFVSVFFITGAVCGALGGLKTLFRTSGFIVLPFLITLLILATSVLFGSNSTNLFPLMGTGVTNSVFKGLAGISVYSDIICIFFITPSEQNHTSTHRSVIIAATIAILINFLMVITYTAKIPYPISAQESSPVYLLLKEVYFGRFFQRIDAFFLLSTSVFSMFSLSLNILLISHILETTFGVKSGRITVIPLGIILFSAVMLIPQTPSTFFATVALIILTVTLLIILLKRKDVSISNEK